MHEKRLSAGWILWPSALLMLLLTTYVAGYFVLGHVTHAYDESGPQGEPLSKFRYYKQEWQANIYRPLGKLETLLTGLPVEILVDDPPT